MLVDSRLIYIYIYIHGQTVLLYQNPSVWLDTQNALNWNPNPADFTSNILSLYYRHLCVSKEFLRYIFIYTYWFPECSIQEQSFAFTRKWLLAIFYSSAQPTVEMGTLSSTDKLFSFCITTLQWG